MRRRRPPELPPPAFVRAETIADTWSFGPSRGSDIDQTNAAGGDHLEARPAADRCMRRPGSARRTPAATGPGRRRSICGESRAHPATPSPLGGLASRRRATVARLTLGPATSHDHGRANPGKVVERRSSAPSWRLAVDVKSAAHPAGSDADFETVLPVPCGHPRVPGTNLARHLGSERTGQPVFRRKVAPCRTAWRTAKAPCGQSGDQLWRWINPHHRRAAWPVLAFAVDREHRSIRRPDPAGLPRRRRNARPRAVRVPLPRPSSRV